jgi:hypothetical protein
MKGKISLPEITHERIREVLDYNPATGEFVWKVSLSKNVPVGSQAGGTAKGTGYRYVTVQGLEIPAARLAWFYMTGEWPRTRVQFSDGDKLNLRFDNLVLSKGVHGEFDFQTREGRTAYLKEYRKANPEKERSRGIRDFGITEEQFEKMFDRQGGKCAICNQPETQMRDGKVKRLAIDHCHTTNFVRGLLCSDCNTGIGKLKDDYKILRQAADYLEKHSSDSSAEHPGSLAPSTGPADTARTMGRNLVQEEG